MFEAVPELLEWLQDANWPVAEPVAFLLKEPGPEIIPHIQKILTGDDGSWKFWVIELLVRNLRFSILAELRDDLQRLANRPSKDDELEEVDRLARQVLAEKFPSGS